MKNELPAGTKDEQRTTADFSTSASVEANPMLADAVQEGNRLIAEFMGVPKCSRCPTECGAYDFNGVYFYPREMEYHSSWDWQMPVVSKVNKVLSPLDHPLIVTRAGIFLNKIHNALSEVSIKSAYKEIVEAIKFYNSNIAVKSD